jgi:hypothetical protein
MAVGNVFPAVSEYGFLAILAVVVLALLATVLILWIVRKDTQSTDFRLGFYGIYIQLRRGQLDTHEVPPAEFPEAHRSVWKRILHKFLRRRTK